MVTRSSKNIPLELPRLGYGCMRMPTLDDGKIVDRKLAIPDELKKIDSFFAGLKK
jgi:predicted aldo/keto reductase-like oxidoreductase